MERGLLKVGGTKVCWSDICLPKDEGGLGLRNPEERNYYQILLHLYRVVNKDRSLWVSWVYTTHLKFNKFWVMEEPTDCSWIWRKVLKLRPIALQFLQYNLGDGRTTSIWFDSW
ncbi:putative mitochondrial protein AtMg00310 [Apium graveolens]|uniref:putative mitochondrial protein AtMg00310 n=1 Tax=Apium graveolens TaxID=4045 RepID=UPI003D78C517